MSCQVVAIPRENEFDTLASLTPMFY